ncbi:MAG: glycosyltransferase [Bifidobacteriaceae bacterium]|jgi:rhamnosyltransferase|nr:glycosyltransferase [Bifidobacteriaceae bacterium]
MTEVHVSVVIPTLNAEKYIAQQLDDLKKQTVQPSEILVIDSSSSDNTVQLARKHGAKVIVIKRSEFNHGGTRHQGFLNTSGEFTIFFTQDAVMNDPECIKNLIAPFSDSDIAMTTGRQIPKGDARPFEALVRKFNYPDESSIRSKADLPRLGIKTYFASDVCAAYRRSAYLEAGGFPRPCNTNEDMLMAAIFINRGFKVAYTANATVSHSHNLSLKEQYRRNKAIGYCLEKNQKILGNVQEIGEGGRLVKAVMKKLVAERHFIEAFAFAADCGARLLGNRSGRATAKKE